MMSIRQTCPGLTLAVSLLAARSGQVQGVRTSIRAPGGPPIPPTVAEGLNRYQNIGLAAFDDWAPEGRQILVSTQFADTNQVHRVEIWLGDRHELSLFRERVAGGHARPGRVPASSLRSVAASGR